MARQSHFSSNAADVIELCCQFFGIFGHLFPLSFRCFLDIFGLLGHGKSIKIAEKCLEEKKHGKCQENDQT